MIFIRYYKLDSCKVYLEYFLLIIMTFEVMHPSTRAERRSAKLMMNNLQKKEEMVKNSGYFNLYMKIQTAKT